MRLKKKKKKKLPSHTKPQTPFLISFLWVYSTQYQEPIIGSCLYPIENEKWEWYNTLFQTKESRKVSRTYPIGRFTLYRPLVALTSLIPQKPQICQLKRAEAPPQLAWKHYNLGSHSVLSQLPLSCWREQDGICWLALCKLQNVFPRSFAQFAYRFQCFLLNQVRPCLNVLIFIFWSLTLLRERSGLAPFKKSSLISQDVWCYFTTDL